jgi:hypothetical protein
VSHDLRKIAVRTLYSHAVMVAGIVAIAVANELVIEHPFGYTEPAWSPSSSARPPCFSPDGPPSSMWCSAACPPRVVGALALVAIIPAMRPVPLLAVATAAVLVLAGVAVADQVRTRNSHPSRRHHQVRRSHVRRRSSGRLRPARPFVRLNGLTHVSSWSCHVLGGELLASAPVRVGATPSAGDVEKLHMADIFG